MAKHLDFRPSGALGSRLFLLGIRGCGGIGRHARFRFWWRKSWGFKSLHPHQTTMAPRRRPAGGGDKAGRGGIPAGPPRRLASLNIGMSLNIGIWNGLAD